MICYCLPPVLFTILGTFTSLNKSTYYLILVLWIFSVYIAFIFIACRTATKAVILFKYKIDFPEYALAYSFREVFLLLGHALNNIFFGCRYHYNVADTRLRQHVDKGIEDGLYISCVASSANLWALIMDAGTGFSSQVYELSPAFLHKVFFLP